MANKITIARFPLLILTLLLLYMGSPAWQFLAVGLVIVVILMDALDGMVARARNETSLLGSVLDIASDRIVEMIFWVAFAHLGLISIVLPLAVIMRGVLTDAIRGVGLSEGLTPFDQIQSEWGRWLVSHRFMRATYGICKTVAFCTLALTLPLQAIAHPATSIIFGTAQICSVIAVTICILRGLPVLVEAWPRLQTVQRAI